MSAAKIRIVGRNNYSLRSEQNINSGTWNGTTRPLDTELVYEIFDMANDDAVQRRGYSGLGAGSRVVVIADDETEYDVTSPAEAIEILSELGVNLPAGSRMRAFKFRASQNRSEVWNGHNHVTCSTSNIEDFLDESARSPEYPGRNQRRLK